MPCWLSSRSSTDAYRRASEAGLSGGVGGLLLRWLPYGRCDPYALSAHAGCGIPTLLAYSGGGKPLAVMAAWLCRAALRTVVLRGLRCGLLGGVSTAKRSMSKLRLAPVANLDLPLTLTVQIGTPWALAAAVAACARTPDFGPVLTLPLAASACLVSLTPQALHTLRPSAPGQYMVSALSTVPNSHALRT